MPIFTYYKIISKDENIKELYVGKTTNFKRRIRDHKNISNNQNCKGYNLKLYKFIRENGGWNNWEFIEIEKNEYNDKDSAFKERYWIEELKATLNNDIPSRTKQEWSKIYRENNKEKDKQYRENRKEIKKEKDKQYRENNKEIIKEKKKEYREKNKDKNKERDKEYYDKNKDKHKERDKEYREKNKEIIKEKKKEYYNKNKETLKEKYKEKINCICGCEITKSSLSKHLKTQKHQEYLLNEIN